MERLVGRKAPDFDLEAVKGDGSSFIRCALSDYKGRWLVLFFYPMDFTFVCPTELTAFSDWHDRFSAIGVDILAISTDSIYSHKAWIADGLGEIKYPIAADQTHKTALQYGVLLEDKGIALRGLFLIDPEQVVRYSVVHDNNIGRSVQETLRVLEALQTGKTCGAGWQPGEKTLNEAETQPTEKAVPSAGGHRVRIYSMPECSYCRKVKEFLAEQGIAYESIDLSSDRQGQSFMKERGYTRLPVTVIDGVEIEGYEMGKFARPSNKPWEGAESLCYRSRKSTTAS